VSLRLIAILVICSVVAAPLTATAETAKKAPAPKAITGGFVLTSSRVVFQGNIYDHGTPTRFRFQWGRTKAYGHIAHKTRQERDGGRLFVEGEIVMRPDTTYHYRLIAFNAGGRSVGQDYFFHTPPG
jgi:hypothetical protein